MITSISAVYDGDVQDPEVEISGSSEEMSNLARQICDFEEHLLINTKTKKDKFYSSVVSEVYFHKVDDDNVMLSVKIVGKRLEFSGGLKYFNSLGESIEELSSPPLEHHYHFQIDQHDGTIISENSTCTLIFMVK